mmetsp:Transcript_17998/g.63598  ORF Transcript_17998/g.63598 Transcript_17998/m.63598 type:complete len:215 (-) Transcript_17998:188-832(-)
MAPASGFAPYRVTTLPSRGAIAITMLRAASAASHTASTAPPDAASTTAASPAMASAADIEEPSAVSAARASASSTRVPSSASVLVATTTGAATPPPPLPPPTLRVLAAVAQLRGVGGKSKGPTEPLRVDTDSAVGDIDTDDVDGGAAVRPRAMTDDSGDGGSANAAEPPPVPPPSPSPPSPANRPIGGSSVARGSIDMIVAAGRPSAASRRRAS